jgi:hypothetical protein
VVRVVIASMLYTDLETLPRILLASDGNPLTRSAFTALDA